MNVHQPVTLRRPLKLAMWEIDAEHGVAGIEVTAKPPRHEFGDAELRFFCASPDMWSQNDVGKILQRIRNVPPASGSLGKTSIAAPLSFPLCRFSASA